jgi:hypothetical protein
MRKFVAACCCVIVGLEVLIAVPLVVCVFALAYMEAAGTTVTVQAQPVDYAASVCSSPATVPAPSYSSGYASTPSPMSTTSPTPWAPMPVTTPAVCPPPPSPEVTAIAEVRQQNGSPLDGTIIAPNNPGPAIEPFVAAVEQVAANETACLMPMPVAPAQAVAAANPVEPSAAPAAPQPGSLVEALRVCSDQLYLKANDLEASGNYGRADEVRCLTRRIRQEIQTFVAEAPVLAPAPATVRAAGFDPQAADPAAVEPTPTTPPKANSVPLADPTVPSAFPSEPPQPASEEPNLPTIPAP